HIDYFWTDIDSGCVQPDLRWFCDRLEFGFLAAHDGSFSSGGFQRGKISRSLLIGVGSRATTTHQTTELEAMLGDGLRGTIAQSALLPPDEYPHDITTVWLASALSLSEAHLRRRELAGGSARCPERPRGERTVLTDRAASQPNSHRSDAGASERSAG